MRRVDYTVRAKRDVTEAKRWYDAELRGLGERFIAAVRSEVETIRREPERYPKYEGEVRHTLLVGFPYTLYYQLEDDRILVVGVLHHARGQDVLRERLP